MLPEPRSPYALTKLSGERRVRFYQFTGRRNNPARWFIL